MFGKIKRKIEEQLQAYVRALDRAYPIRKLSPHLYRNLKSFILSRGKRLRPVLFSLSYLGFARRPARGYASCAIAFELLHDFILIHDDIIDNSELRRGKPTLHKMFDTYINGFPHVKFTGKDISIIVGDLIYGLGIRAFMDIEEKPERKERALRKLLDASVYTGTGQFLELLSGLRPVGDVSKNDILRIYDLKTACYSFCAPLAIGAVLGGASAPVVKQLERCGLLLGRAFQVRDDILGLFGSEKEVGKSPLTDIRESKRTILIWHAFRHADQKTRSYLSNVLAKKDPGCRELEKIREIILAKGSLYYAGRVIEYLFSEAKAGLTRLPMKKRFKKLLTDYAEELLKFKI
jgi:geranylgeranyl diphosphate synthase, type I